MWPDAKIIKPVLNVTPSVPKYKEDNKITWSSQNPLNYLTLKGGGVFNEKSEYKGSLDRTWDKIRSDLIFRNLSTSPKRSNI